LTVRPEVSLEGYAVCRFSSLMMTECGVGYSDMDCTGDEKIAYLKDEI